MAETTSFGARLKAARLAAGRTEKQIADAIEVSPRTIINWEHDLGGPGVPQVVLICDALKMPRDDRYAFVFGRGKGRAA